MIRAVLTLLAALGFAAAPFFWSFDGFETNQLPIPQTDPPAQPAGWAFSIWGPIYAWLVVSALWGLWAHRQDAWWDAVRAPLIASLAIGVPWLWIATQSAVWATLAIVAMAGFAIAALLRAPRDDRSRWTLRAPVALYAGWLTAASWVSIAATLAGYGIGPDSYGWAFVAIAAAALIAWAVQSRTPEWTYGLAVGWALLGIAVKNGPALPLVTAAALAALLLIALRAAQSARRAA
ncbi:hypothetical protein [Wenxinia saemankumensis]|uniref:TspO and MBR related proteins n=1 Tax=Wenxinia saemankumensis TaxID=1447782 RepID=A0A1M6EWS9_9RHOB|nr:hypothetical protein [Wenxinia saemankumensis]SHI89839.1 TspO and MBR related proteins [Wenxinia saemankumensis]